MLRISVNFCVLVKFSFCPLALSVRRSRLCVFARQIGTQASVRVHSEAARAATDTTTRTAAAVAEVERMLRTHCCRDSWDIIKQEVIRVHLHYEQWQKQEQQKASAAGIETARAKDLIYVLYKPKAPRSGSGSVRSFSRPLSGAKVGAEFPPSSVAGRGHATRRRRALTWTGCAQQPRNNSGFALSAQFPWEENSTSIVNSS